MQFTLERTETRTVSFSLHDVTFQVSLSSGAHRVNGVPEAGSLTVVIQVPGVDDRTVHLGPDDPITLAFVALVTGSIEADRKVVSKPVEALEAQESEQQIL